MLFTSYNSNIKLYNIPNLIYFSKSEIAAIVVSRFRIPFSIFKRAECLYSYHYKYYNYNCHLSQLLILYIICYILI